MNTRLIHYRNSFLEVSNQKFRLLMDPWVNTANHDSWAGTLNGGKYILNSINKSPIDYIYFSHLHADHYDEKFLRELAKKNNKIITLIVKKFKDQRFKKKIMNSGIKNIKIIETDPYKKLKLKDGCNLWILPQLSASNTPNYLVNYDLDTSCVFKNNDLCLFNQTDNPYSEKDIKYVIQKLKKNNIPTKFDITFIPYCAASAYPQNFINLNRQKIKKELIINRLKKFFKISKILNGKIVVPAGGSYRLNRGLYKLNKYVAIPSFNLIEKNKKKLNISINMVDTNKKYFIFNNGYILKNKNFNKYFNNKINKNSFNYPICKKFNKKSISKELLKLEKNILEWKKKIYNKCKTEIVLLVHKNQLNGKKLINRSDFIEHKINFGAKSKKIILKIHLNYKILNALIYGKFIFNEIQTHLIYERAPNIYDPDAEFWMNLYKY